MRIEECFDDLLCGLEGILSRDKDPQYGNRVDGTIRSELAGVIVPGVSQAGMLPTCQPASQRRLREPDKTGSLTKPKGDLSDRNPTSILNIRYVLSEPLKKRRASIQFGLPTQSKGNEVNCLVVGGPCFEPRSSADARLPHDLGRLGRIRYLLPGRPGQEGGFASDNRQFIDAVLGIARTGAASEDLPERPGKGNSIAPRRDGHSINPVSSRIGHGSNEMSLSVYPDLMPNDDDQLAIRAESLRALWRVLRAIRSGGFSGKKKTRKLSDRGASVKSRWWDLNPRPPLYESGALPLSYIG